MSGRTGDVGEPMSRVEGRRVSQQPRRNPGPESSGGVGPESSGGVWGLKSPGFEGPRAVWSVWEGSQSEIGRRFLVQWEARPQLYPKTTPRLVSDDFGKSIDWIALLQMQLHAASWTIPDVMN